VFSITSLTIRVHKSLAGMGVFMSFATLSTTSIDKQKKQVPDSWDWNLSDSGADQVDDGVLGGGGSPRRRRRRPLEKAAAL
jgi:hypothetical protein